MKNLEWTAEMPTLKNEGELFLLVADGIENELVQIKRASSSTTPEKLYIEYEKTSEDGEGEYSVIVDEDLSELKNALWFGPIPEPKEVA